MGGGPVSAKNPGEGADPSKPIVFSGHPPPGSREMRTLRFSHKGCQAPRSLDLIIKPRDEVLLQLIRPVLVNFGDGPPRVAQPSFGSMKTQGLTCSNEIFPPHPYRRSAGLVCTILRTALGGSPPSSRISMKMRRASTGGGLWSWPASEEITARPGPIFPMAEDFRFRRRGPRGDLRRGGSL